MDRTCAFAIAALVTLGLAATTAPAQEAERPPVAQKQPAPAETTRVVMRVDGLACPFCAYGLEKKLKRLEAVKAVEVKLDEGRVYLQVEPGKTLSDEALAKIVEEAGFVLRGVDRAGAPRASR